jgi:hypothetical protein
MEEMTVVVALIALVAFFFSPYDLKIDEDEL